MVRYVRRHRADHAEVVGVLRRVVEKLADFEAAFPVTLEFKGRPQGRSRRPLGLQSLQRHRFPVELLKLRFPVEGIHLRRAAVHEEVNHPLRLRGEVGLGSHSQ